MGYGDGSLRIFDLRTGDVERSVSDAAATHTGPVACLAARAEGGAILATGGTDGLTKVLNINTGKNIAAFDCRTNQQREKAEDRLDGYMHKVTTYKARQYSSLKGCRYPHRQTSFWNFQRPEFAETLW